MNEWRELKTLQEVAAAQAAGEEIECALGELGWRLWYGADWKDAWKFRARPKAETVTLRKALIRYKNGCEVVLEGNEKYVESFRHTFIGWLGDPVTYEVKK